MDVLKNYMTYKISYRIAKEIDDNPERQKQKRFVQSPGTNLSTPGFCVQKTEVMIEQFRSVTKKEIGGQAKAMVVTPSRLHAVRYMQEFKLT